MTHRYHVMIRMPEITTAIRIPVPVARNASAMFIVVFLCSGRWKYKKPGELFAGL